MAPTRIALLGAARTGKTTLAHELAAHLQGRGFTALAVPDALRAWCERAGRAPLPEEQLAIAHEQEAQVDAAAAQAQIVIADTTALMVAIQANLPDEDAPLHRFAIERQRHYDATLVTGLDLAGASDTAQRDAAQAREDVDARLRAQLQRAGIAYQVVYGQGPQRLASALQALAAAGALPAGAHERASDEGERGGWVWVCDKCSDPACEHRLFTKLRDARR